MDFIKETLDFVNRERVARGIGEPLDELPKGIQGESCKCPIANALKCEVGTHDLFFYAVEEDAEHATHRWDAVALPECAEQFVEAFDNGELPQFDENADA
ncbi:MAG: hypothetical protein ACXVGC_12210 [Mycobacteriaceae bacterium]